MSFLQAVLERNATFAAVRHWKLARRPSNNAVVVTCVDCRVDPAHFLGVQLGETFVVRTVGGRVSPAVEQQLAMIVAMLRANGDTAPIEVLLVHHDDCGFQRMADPANRAAMSAASGVEDEVIAKLAIHDHEQSLRDDLAVLKASTMVPDGLVVAGLRYDPETGVVATHFVDVS